MKKLFFALCAVAALGMTACNKENQNNGNNGNNNQQEQIPEGEGIYNPAKHIASVEYGDATVETWNWVDRKLQSITTSDFDGNNSMATFSYNGWRLSQMTMEGGDFPGTVTYSYSGDKMSNFTISSAGMQMASVDIVHTGDKITHLDMNVDNAALQMLVNMLGNMGDFGGLFTPAMGNQLTASIARAAQAATKGGKFTVGDTEFDVDFTWTGENVSRVLLTATINVGVTGDELSQLMSLDPSMSTYASLLSYVAGDQELPVVVTVNDTMEYTYDNHVNPKQGFFGAVNITLDADMLSANNTASATNHGTVSADITITIPFLGAQHIPYSQAIGDGEIIDYTYIYNAAGYPATVEGSDGSVTIYTYQEQ